jgi:release factor glutamine methyltransferase
LKDLVLPDSFFLSQPGMATTSCSPGKPSGHSVASAWLWIYDRCHLLLKALRSNHTVIRLLFGVRIPRGMRVQFDPTTILLSRVLRRIVTDRDHTSLEIGIGQGALVSLSLARTRPMIRIIGIDCSAARVLQSRQVAEANSVAVDFFDSDLFAGVPPASRYDLIVFNPPYVPTETGRRLKLTERLAVDGDFVWDGGADGTAVLARFLQAAKGYLSDRGRVVFGVQPLFVSEDQVLNLIGSSGLLLQERSSSYLIPSVCYVLKQAAETSPSTL